MKFTQAGADMFARRRSRASICRQCRDLIDSVSADIGEILHSDASADPVASPVAQLALFGGLFGDGDQLATRFPGSASHL